MIIFFISLLLTGERANILRGIFIAFMFILLSKKSVITHKKIFLILILLLTASTYFFSEKIRYKFNVVFQPIKNFEIIEAFKQTQHSAHYYTALKIYENYPFFGSGNKTFREQCLKDKYKNDNYLRTAERCASHPHQIYFELLSEHGSVGTITIISIIFFILLKSFKAYLKSKNSVHLASILFIISQFLPIIPNGSFFTSWGATIFWINFAILLFYSNKICTK
jgi:O-antigen ligase